MKMSAARLEVRNLNAGYGPTRIVSDMSFDVAAGGRLTILGRNGVGKTTLLAALMGISTQQGGTIHVGGADISTLKTADRARLGLGYVPQTRDIFRSLTVDENLVSGLKGRKREALDEAYTLFPRLGERHEAYTLFPRLGERRRNLGLQLSGGEQQMLSLARTLLGKPSILLLDEPLEGLAPVICDQIMTAITALAEAGDMTIVLVEQQIDRALDFADRVIVVERGRCVWEGECSSLKTDHALVDRLLGVGLH
jgi:branched-chain amino acid transport system ATP-binding protein